MKIWEEKSSCERERSGLCPRGPAVGERESESNHRRWWRTWSAWLRWFSPIHEIFRVVCLRTLADFSSTSVEEKRKKIPMAFPHFSPLSLFGVRMRSDAFAIVWKWVFPKFFAENCLARVAKKLKIYFRERVKIFPKTHFFILMISAIYLFSIFIILFLPNDVGKLSLFFSFSLLIICKKQILRAGTLTLSSVFPFNLPSSSLINEGERGANLIDIACTRHTTRFFTRDFPQFVIIFRREFFLSSQHRSFPLFSTTINIITHSLSLSRTASIIIKLFVFCESSGRLGRKIDRSRRQRREKSLRIKFPLTFSCSAPVNVFNKPKLSHFYWQSKSSIGAGWFFVFVYSKFIFSFLLLLCVNFPPLFCFSLAD